MSIVRAAAALTGLGLLALGTGCSDPHGRVVAGGPSIAVLFDERHGLEGGELVRLHEFDIGIVEAVDLLGSRVRANIRLAPDALDNLTVATTFRVETEGAQRYLETYVLDADADRLAAGTTLAGADGTVELIAMRASFAAGSFAEATRSSEWWEQATDFIDEMRKELDATDWTKQEEDLRQEWERAIDQMDEALEQGKDELESNIDALIQRLEQAGHSDEAQTLKERFEEFLGELR